ncbi:unnamed protein product [Knipowitschia caucasica]|uniref:ATPase H+ transporting accessory protein 1b n=1 Tax=Knipowitschia caucasica TaxID=637954 RepID=A0AAV2LZ13_KNICA
MAQCSAKSSFILCFCLFWSSGASETHVPLLVWSSHSLPPVSPPAEGHITSHGELGLFLSAALSSGSHTVLLFLQERLSQDDFTLYGGVYGNKEDSAFKNLEAALQSHSTVFPAVECSRSSSVPVILEQELGVEPLLLTPDALENLKLDATVSNLLLISLPYCHQNQLCREELRRNDEVIGRVLKTLEAKNVPYTAIFTGLQPSRMISESSFSAPVGRSLLQSPAPPPSVRAPIMFSSSVNPCIMMWAQNINVSFTETGEDWTDLSTQTPNVTGSLCNGSNSILVLNYNAGITLSFFMSQRFFPVSARRWFNLDSVQLRQNAVSASFSSRSIYAPAEYSYHCQMVNSFRDALLINENTNASWRLNFIDFQIQGFGLANTTDFSYASDCAGFFTAGIWMGLITSLLMLLIFVYGLQMILQLNTMDRFDDPKGPCISVPQTD